MDTHTYAREKQESTAWLEAVLGDTEEDNAVLMKARRYDTITGQEQIITVGRMTIAELSARLSATEAEADILREMIAEAEGLVEAEVLRRNAEQGR